MKVDASVSSDPEQIGDQAQRLEALGFDGLRVAETDHDPFIALTLAADRTDKVQLVTSVAVAFARNPMSMALTAHELNAFSKGRLVLGLGSQVKPHIERRFSMQWHKPARQMREFIRAMHAIFDCWYDGSRLEFEGEYYRHDLMPRTFSPQNTRFGRPKILLSATGPLMTKVAAEVADGMIAHPFSTERYLREVTLPAIEAGSAQRGMRDSQFELDYAPMIAAGDSDEAVSSAMRRVKERIAFYARTRAYRPVLELHGWGALQDELIALHRQHRDSETVALISDDILHEMALVGSYREVVRELRRRFSDIVARTGFNAPQVNDATLQELLAQLKAS